MDVTEIRSRDGRTWRLKFTLRGLSWFEEQTGIKATKLESFDNLWIREQATLIASGLYHENPDVTIDDGFDFLDSVDQDELQRAFGAVARDAGGDLEPEENSGESTNGTTPKNASGAGSKPKQKQPKSA